ncbi:hypothetical protein ABBQ38_013382 [Trebouxia sp. C0009 RCD-2024]
MSETAEANPLLEKYTRPAGSRHRKLGLGGGCDYVEEWVNVQSNESFAVKKISAETHEQRSYLLYNEWHALELLKNRRVARVVKLEETLYSANGDIYLVLELVKGPTLWQHNFAQRKKETRLRNLIFPGEYECNVLDLGAQLLQTMEAMHSAGIAHLDLTPVNILVQSSTDSPALKIIDFGLSNQISTVVGASVYPLEACAPYAAPEVLDSILSRCHPSPDGFIRVNGAAADSWSVGIVMFEALTSDVPFKLRPYSLPQVPEYVTEKGAKTWQFIAGTRQHQQLWIDAVDAADKMRSAVRYQDIIETLELTSTDPTNAVDFFMKILHPDPEARMTMAEAARHPYMARAMQRLSTKAAHAQARDDGHSTAAVSATLATPAQAHSTCQLATGKNLSHVMANSTADAHAPGFEGDSHRLYPTCQLSRLPQALSTACNVFAGFLRRFSRARATPPSPTLSKQAIHRIMNLNADCSNGLVPPTQEWVSDGTSEPETDHRLTKAKGQHMSTTKQSACTSSSASSCTETGAAEGEPDSSASDVR